MFNTATLFMYVSVPSQEPVIQWFSFVYVIHICFSFIFFNINKVVSFLVCIVLQCLIGTFYSWLCGMGFAHCWRPIVVNFCVMFVSWWELSNWQLYHIFCFMWSENRSKMLQRRIFNLLMDAFVQTEKLKFWNFWFGQKMIELIARGLDILRLVAIKIILS